MSCANGAVVPFWQCRRTGFVHAGVVAKYHPGKSMSSFSPLVAAQSQGDFSSRFFGALIRHGMGRQGLSLTGGCFMHKVHCLVLLVVLWALGGCASLDNSTRQRQVASVLSYLFPGSEQAPPMADQIAAIKVPLRIGIAFVPDNAATQFRLPESHRLKLAGQVRDAFATYPFIGEILAVPSMYLEPGCVFQRSRTAIPF